MSPSLRPMFRFFNRSKALSPERKKQLLAAPDFLPYTPNEERFRQFWDGLSKKKWASFLFTDGVNVKRVNVFQYFWELIRGVFGYQNRCKKSHVNLTLSKLAYVAYINSWEIPDTNAYTSVDLSVFRQPLTDENTLEAQTALMQRYNDLFPKVETFNLGPERRFGSTILSADYSALFDLSLERTPSQLLNELTLVLPSLTQEMPADHLFSREHKIPLMDGQIDEVIRNALRNGKLAETLHWARTKELHACSLLNTLLTGMGDLLANFRVNPDVLQRAHEDLSALTENNPSLKRRFHLIFANYYQHQNMQTELYIECAQMHLDGTYGFTPEGEINTSELVDAWLLDRFNSYFAANSLPPFLQEKLMVARLATRLDDHRGILILARALGLPHDDARLLPIQIDNPLEEARAALNSREPWRQRTAYDYLARIDGITTEQILEMVIGANLERLNQFEPGTFVTSLPGRTLEDVSRWVWEKACTLVGHERVDYRTIYHEMNTLYPKDNTPPEHAERCSLLIILNLIHRGFWSELGERLRENPALLRNEVILTKFMSVIDTLEHFQDIFTSETFRDMPVAQLEHVFGTDNTLELPSHRMGHLILTSLGRDRFEQSPFLHLKGELHSLLHQWNTRQQRPLQEQIEHIFNLYTQANAANQEKMKPLMEALAHKISSDMASCYRSRRFAWDHLRLPETLVAKFVLPAVIANRDASSALVLHLYNYYDCETVRNFNTGGQHNAELLRRSQQRYRASTIYSIIALMQNEDSRVDRLKNEMVDIPAFEAAFEREENLDLYQAVAQHYLHLAQPGRFSGVQVTHATAVYRLDPEVLATDSQVTLALVRRYLATQRPEQALEILNATNLKTAPMAAAVASDYNAEAIKNTLEENDAFRVLIATSRFRSAQGFLTTNHDQRLDILDILPNQDMRMRFLRQNYAYYFPQFVSRYRLDDARTLWNHLTPEMKNSLDARIKASFSTQLKAESDQLYEDIASARDCRPDRRTQAQWRQLNLTYKACLDKVKVAEEANPASQDILEELITFYRLNGSLALDRLSVVTAGAANYQARRGMLNQSILPALAAIERLLPRLPASAQEERALINSFKARALYCSLELSLESILNSQSDDVSALVTEVERQFAPLKTFLTPLASTEEGNTYKKLLAKVYYFEGRVSERFWETADVDEQLQFAHREEGDRAWMAHRPSRECFARAAQLDPTNAWFVALSSGLANERLAEATPVTGFFNTWNERAAFGDSLLWQSRSARRHSIFRAVTTDGHPGETLPEQPSTWLPLLGAVRRRDATPPVYNARDEVEALLRARPR